VIFVEHFMVVAMMSLSLFDRNFACISTLAVELLAILEFDLVCSMSFGQI
jgi:predicted membrane metal-binding protein